jgi:hypothetical protein
LPDILLLSLSHYKNVIQPKLFKSHREQRDAENSSFGPYCCFVLSPPNEIVIFGRSCSRICEQLSGETRFTTKTFSAIMPFYRQSQAQNRNPSHHPQTGNPTLS